MVKGDSSSSCGHRKGGRLLPQRMEKQPVWGEGVVVSESDTDAGSRGPWVLLVGGWGDWMPQSPAVTWSDRF